MAKFKSVFLVEVELEISDDLLKAVDNEEWRSSFYRLNGGQEVANHLAYNLACNRSPLSQLDGFADRPAGDVKVLREEWTVED